MDVDGVLKLVDEWWPDDSTDPVLDPQYAEIVEHAGGMATPSKLALLNEACRRLGEDEVYLEVGAFHGTSVIGAARGQTGKRFVTVDNFSEFGGDREVCERNIATMGEGNIELIVGDAWQVLADAPFANRVGVFFYDGRHHFADQYRAFAAVAHLLTDDALVFVDDTRFPWVSSADRLYVEHDRRFTLSRALLSPKYCDPRWWNGVEIYRFSRTGAVSSPSRVVYEAQRMYYDVWRNWHDSGWELRTRRSARRMKLRAKNLMAKRG
jgi:predicted O-methyltransferase YrrM